MCEGVEDELFDELLLSGGMLGGSAASAAEPRDYLRAAAAAATATDSRGTVFPAPAPSEAAVEALLEAAGEELAIERRYSPAATGAGPAGSAGFARAERRAAAGHAKAEPGPGSSQGVDGGDQRGGSAAERLAASGAEAPAPAPAPDSGGGRLAGGLVHGRASPNGWLVHGRERGSEAGSEAESGGDSDASEVELVVAAAMDEAALERLAGAEKDSAGGDGGKVQGR